MSPCTSTTPSSPRRPPQGSESVHAASETSDIVAQLQMKGSWHAAAELHPVGNFVLTGLFCWPVGLLGTSCCSPLGQSWLLQSWL